MKINWNQLNRKTHFWGAAICAIPVIIMIVTGMILQFKKESDWVQPPSMKGSGKIPTIAFATVLEAAQSVEKVGIQSWSDIDRLDVRPTKGIIKIRANNRWEIQIDHQTGEVLTTAYRRSDLIESIHDGSFFHEYAKLWLFFPAAVILLVLWITGMYLFIKTLITRSKKKRKSAQKLSGKMSGELSELC